MNNFEGLDRWKRLGLIFIKFESLEVMYPHILKCSDASGVFIFV